MASKYKGDKILEKWVASLKERDRSRPAVAGNFEDLIESLHRSKIKFDDARDLLDVAIKAHYPSNHVAKKTYSSLKKVVDKNYTEFVDDWKGNIADTAKNVFYSFYDIDGEAPKEEVKYGNMSAGEYRKQRKYAESHPLLDWEKIDLKPIEEDIDLDDMRVDLEGLDE